MFEYERFGYTNVSHRMHVEWVKITQSTKATIVYSGAKETGSYHFQLS